MSDSDYALDYLPPRVAVVIGTMLRKPREVGHSVEFSDIFSSFQERRIAYYDGLSVVPVIFLSLFLGWMFVIMLLKCKGKEVGCASGQAFVSLRSNDEEYQEDEDEEEVEYGEDKLEVDLTSTGDSSHTDSYGESSVKPIFVGAEGRAIQHSDSDISDDGKKFLRCLRRRNANKRNPGINRIERGTRISFLIFAFLALICAPLCIVLTFGPLRDVSIEMSTTETPDALFFKIQNTIDNVQKSLDTITLLSADAVQKINNVPTDLEDVCPLVKVKDLKATIGVDIQDIVDTIISQQDSLEAEIAAQLSTQQSRVDGVEDQFSTIEAYADKYQNLLWILPALLLLIIGLTVTSVAGVITAWKRKSSTRFQKILSYCVLPLLLLVAIACWVVLMAFALTTMVGTDMCFSTSFSGSPDQTIQDVLSSTGNGTVGSLQHFASTYVIDCEGSEPTKDIRRIKLYVQEQIDNIWREVSKIDAIGRVTVIERCGDAEQFSRMLSGARDLAIILTDIRRALSSIEESIGCESIHSLYTEASQDIICTQTLSASSYGFITFLVMWISVLAMISLRASWLWNNDEEKVYHDENEIAENMVVDEHEEYLAYISKYKHEWQEYEGIEEDGVLTPSPRSDFHDEQPLEILDDSDQRYYYGDDEQEVIFVDSKSDMSTLDSGTFYSTDSRTEVSDLYQRKLTTREIMDQHDDGVSYASGAISFDSLSSEIKSDVLNLDNILTLPPPMNPEYSSAPPMSSEYSVEKVQEQRNGNFDDDQSEDSILHFTADAENNNDQNQDSGSHFSGDLVENNEDQVVDNDDSDSQVSTDLEGRADQNDDSDSQVSADLKLSADQNDDSGSHVSGDSQNDTTEDLPEIKGDHEDRVESKLYEL